jgi:hypothetical protein
MVRGEKRYRRVGNTLRNEAITKDDLDHLLDRYRVRPSNRLKPKQPGVVRKVPTVPQ